MRLIIALVLTLSAAGCGTMQYENTSAAVDANPLCTSQPDRPGEPVSSNCERKATGSWSTERKSEPVDLSGKKKEN
jgi:hypothetical protein